MRILPCGCPTARRGSLQEREIPLKNLKNFFTISPGQKIAYVTDCRFTKENMEKIIALAREADLFFCEAGFLEKDRERAEERAHLTARQAGELGRLANAGRLQIFHFSPKYEKEPEALFGKRRKLFGDDVRKRHLRALRFKTSSLPGTLKVRAPPQRAPRACI